MKRWKLLLIAAVALIAALVVGTWMLTGPPLEPPPLPEPNGYDQLVQIAQGMRTVPDYSTASLDELAGFVTNHTGSLQLAREAFEMECRVPLGYSPEYVNQHLPDLSAIKSMAQAFAAEGHWHEAEGRTNQAVKSYLDTVQLGTDALRGGVLIDELVAVACRAIGLTHLEGIVDDLDAQTCRNAIIRLQKLDARMDSPEDAIQRERAWSRRTFGIQARLLAFLPKHRESIQKAHESLEGRHENVTRTHRAVLLALAERAFELEHERAPTSLEELVPEFLDRPPVDPATGVPLPLAGGR